jgi:signal transduction histidine kinase
MAISNMSYINFTVDAALLQELGERLVGKPHIALAELVKNSYDADAHEVTIDFAVDQDRIEVHDDGHGMTFEEFKNFWMRVGTTHKSQKRVSRDLKRRMTGSKGVGRLAVQLLASELTMLTVPKDRDGRWLEASVNWTDAVRAGDLVDARMYYTEKTSPPPFEQGTLLVLTGLKHEWSEEEVEGLATELWWLQPPFRSSLAPQDRFEIDFRAARPEFEEVFEKQIRAIMRIWMARLVGKNEDGHVLLSLEFEGSPPQRYDYRIADFPHNEGEYDREKNLNDGDFEIRIYSLRYRQPHGIRVGEAREYFWKYGGVHVYDGGFRLPHYGDPKNDWLKLEFDHAHRRFQSELLPSEFQARYAETERLRYLPTLGRVFGVVNVDTSHERNLHIMITRDRLAETKAFEDLLTMVRYAFDLYAFERARQQFEGKLEPTEETSLKFERVEQVLEHYEPQIPKGVYVDLRARVREAATAATTSQEIALRQMGLLGPLATAGISALAYQHELKKQFSTVEGILEKMSQIRAEDVSLRRALDSLRNDLSSWLQRARATNALFDYMADAENIEIRDRFRATEVLSDVQKQVQFLARGIDVDTSRVDDPLYLPEASLAEWGAIFQNVFTNAFNAVVDSEKRLVQASSRVKGPVHEILVQDTGSGVDLRDAERLFEPFQRGTKTPRQRRALGYGGTGLGLTIVRLLADRLGCRVGFVEPEDGFSTAFSLSWREKR